MDLPACLIVGTGNKAPVHIIKEIFSNNLPKPKQLEDGVDCYEWSFETKYYTATVALCSLETKSLVNQEFASNIHAVVVYADDTHEDQLLPADQWLPFIKEFEPEVKILVCDQCSSEDSHESSGSLPKDKAHHWCLEHGFELVELNPSDLPDPDDDFQETVGIPRIVQALQSHMWPNLVLKECGSAARMDRLRNFLNEEDMSELSDIQAMPRRIISEENGFNTQGLISEHQDDNRSSDANDNEDDDTDSETSESAQENGTAHGYQVLEEEVDMTGADVDTFESLFQQFSNMRVQAGQLRGTERKIYAEQVAMAFWRAIGGDDEDISGLEGEDEK